MADSERDELVEKIEQYRRLIDWALDQLTLDNIRELVREMEEKLSDMDNRRIDKISD